jgi:hypothetical protein
MGRSKGTPGMPAVPVLRAATEALVVTTCGGSRERF